MRRCRRHGERQQRPRLEGGGSRHFGEDDLAQPQIVKNGVDLFRPQISFTALSKLMMLKAAIDLRALR
jgi:hypothetical protein